jgi:aryl-alcohol dehydrogenase-like predicted oxidoreductase
VTQRANRLAAKPRPQAANNALVRPIAPTTCDLDAERGARVATVALAWLIAAPTLAAPTASATSTDQRSQLLAAVDPQLGADELWRLTAAGS